MLNILIADDNKQISKVLYDYAKKEGFNPSLVYDGEEVIREFKQNKFDMILLDVMMPKKDGFEVCREIRRESNVPIIMITARGEDFEKIMGFDIGADDYIVKPFSPGEVMARIRAILRRVNRDDVINIIRIDNLKIDNENLLVTIEDNEVILTKKEFEILQMLTSNVNKIFTRDNILTSLWGYDYLGDTRTVDSHIKRLRSKLDKYSHPSWEIKTVWGMGYKVEVNFNEK